MKKKRVKIPPYFKVGIYYIENSKGKFMLDEESILEEFYSTLESVRNIIREANK